MKLRKLAFTFATIAIAVTPGMAQHPGFRVGIAPAFSPAIVAPTVNPPIVIPGFAQPMVVPFTTQSATFGFPASGLPNFGFPTFGFQTFGVPTFGFPPIQAPLIVTRPEFHHGNGFVAGHRAPEQIIVPGAVFVNTPQAPFGPPPARGEAITPAAPRAPRLGMPRAEVLKQFGQPSASVITRTGETLYFGGGVTVIIENGQVAGPK